MFVFVLVCVCLSLSLSLPSVGNSLSVERGGEGETATNYFVLFIPSSLTRIHWCGGVFYGEKCVWEAEDEWREKNARMGETSYLTNTIAVLLA